MIQHLNEKSLFRHTKQILWHRPNTVVPSAKGFNLESKRFKNLLILFHFLLFFEIQRNDDRRADDLGRHVSRFHFFYDPLIQHFFVRCMLVDDIQFIFHLYQPVSVKDLPDDLMMFFCFRA